MPKPATYPTLFDDCKTVSITSLKKWGYLSPNQYKSGVITWSRNGNKTASISITVNTTPENSYINLNYTCNGNTIDYNVYLVSLPANIGKGTIYYFVCPRTGKRCRKLYLADTYFYHRSAFKGCMYEKQTYSHKWRSTDKLCEMAFGGEKANEQIYQKHFKKYYSGKSTKRYLKLWKRVMKSSKITHEQIERMFIL